MTSVIQKLPFLEKNILYTLDNRPKKKTTCKICKCKSNFSHNQKTNNKLNRKYKMIQPSLIYLCSHQVSSVISLDESFSPKLPSKSWYSENDGCDSSVALYAFQSRISWRNKSMRTYIYQNHIKHTYVF